MPSKQVPASTLTSDNASAVDEVGARREAPSGRVYRFVQVDTGVAIGDVVGWFSSGSLTSFKVSPDISKCPAKRAAGVALGTITDEQYGWIQSRGLNTRVKTDGSAAAGNALVWVSDNVASVMAAGEEHIVFAFARLADSGTVLTGANLVCLD